MASITQSASSTPETTPLTGRFAPSPTGRMHAGNIYAALIAWIVAKRTGGEVVLRIENLDPDRSKPEYIDQIMRDFEYLGLTWDRGPYYQSTRTDVYAEAFDDLQKRGLTYPCFCTRADLHTASAPHRGEKTVYPGTCRNLTANQRAQAQMQAQKQGRAPSQRLMVPAEDVSAATVQLTDAFQGHYAQNLARDCGDFLIRRSDGAFAYQLAVVLDDAEQGVTSVVRGVDLLCSTPQQIYLQNLLNLPHPEYGHVPLLVAKAGGSDQSARRLSKRDKDAGLDQLKQRYKTPEGILGHIAYVAGMVSPEAVNASLEDGIVPHAPSGASATLQCSAQDLLETADLAVLCKKIQIPWQN